MRTIKFRAWDKINKIMRDVPNLQFNADGKTIGVEAKDENGFDIMFIVGESCELMQHTGLKDKNGKEIYEGDIVKIKNKNCEIRFNAGGRWDYLYEYKNRNGYSFEMLGELEDEDSEVIGNIYENPDLIS